jgi:hypothetical protein
MYVRPTTIYDATGSRIRRVPATPDRVGAVIRAPGHEETPDAR